MSPCRLFVTVLLLSAGPARSADRKTKLQKLTARVDELADRINSVSGTVYDDQKKTTYNAVIYGAEYENHPEPTHDKDVVCAVCATSGRAMNLMMPAKNTCPAGWNLEYTGHLMAGYHGHGSATEFLCMDSAMETDHSSEKNDNGKLFYYVLGQCGSLNCPPYENDRVLTCSVCSK
nr:hypothetical protein BaRGS_024557 [Batillaria attramentaria]